MEKSHIRKAFDATFEKPALPVLGLLFAALVLFFFRLHVLALIFVLAAMPFYVMMFRQDAFRRRSIATETSKTDEQLHLELLELQKLAIAKLGNADVQLQVRVADLLIDAAKHLGYPYLGGRRVYAEDATLVWNKEGLALASEARALIEEYLQNQSESGSAA
ncbi:MAG TPA: hypothetical protein PL112_21485 [Candidatus Obscuribacter sp.]|nr:hypothetical protein [Candidatus Obscuribacter sp.]HND69393.1 hypothetical protein [Candidatus Obscuribacter sp.]